MAARSLSRFEAVVTTYPPVLESLLAQLPTAALVAVYHASPYLRAFLRRYPLAWKTLSFRLPPPAASLAAPGTDTPDSRDRPSRPYALDALLRHVVAPHATCLVSLDLCNTAVSGVALVACVLAPRLGSLRHLSVRGCKNVSIKYHLVPFLEPYALADAACARSALALRSLYTYRCRHHRRRPYLPSSLVRRDSDSDPTHQLIDLCHRLDIWSDTAWCPTPAARCNRRKDYHQGRAGPQNLEVWVPFDRLWRSGNRIGPTDTPVRLGTHDGRLWEVADQGHDGEPLGPDHGAAFAGEGKHVPAHLRRSHTRFVHDVTCAQCHERILERCESCSVRMHCMACRKTLCASCAFDKPVPRKRSRTRHFATLAFGPGHGSAANAAPALEAAARRQEPVDKDRFWWAPGASRSPNLMNESAQDDESSDSEDGATMHNGLPLPPPPASREPPKLNMTWCCLEPIFSGGGGIAVLGTGLGGRGADKIRAAPLPQRKGFEDPDFGSSLPPVDYVRELKTNGLYEYVVGDDVDLLAFLSQDSLDLQQNTCPRALCQDCYRSFRWKVSCRACRNPICKEHDFRALKVRKCGYRHLPTERDYVRSHNHQPLPRQRLAIPEFNHAKNRPASADPDRTPTATPSHNHCDATAEDDHESHISESLLSQSQVFGVPSALASMDMSATTSSHSTTTNDPLTLAASHSHPLVRSSRPRSYSVSGVRGRSAGSWPASPHPHASPVAKPLPLPCNPRHPVQWQGCGAYFCHYPRPMGDNRPQCPALLKECSECAVQVCEQCFASNPTCACTFCTVNYHCPACTRKPHVRAKCRLDAEVRARKDAELRTLARLAKDREERGQADELAGAVFEFFAGVFEHGDAAEPPSLVDIDHTHDTAGNSTRAGSPDDVLPLPSPDSITVTTEFGVVEEPANVNVTTISVGVAPWQVHTTHYHHPGYQASPQHYPDEESQVEMTENLHEALGWTHMNVEQGFAIHHNAPDVPANEFAAVAQVDVHEQEHQFVPMDSSPNNTGNSGSAG